MEVQTDTRIWLKLNSHVLSSAGALSQIFNFLHRVGLPRQFIVSLSFSLSSVTLSR